MGEGGGAGVGQAGAEVKAARLGLSTSMWVGAGETCSSERGARSGQECGRLNR